jgi:hypothetical protein
VFCFNRASPGLKRRRGTVQTEMDSDSAELSAIDKECAVLQVLIEF